MDLIDIVARIGGAFLLALPLAWDRGLAARSLGLRTFPLVAIASCGFVLLSTEVLGGSPEARARVIQGLMTGVGFVGGGAILKHGDTVHGTATAASIWNVGAMGAAAAYGRWDLGIVLSLVNLATLHGLSKVKTRLDRKE